MYSLLSTEVCKRKLIILSLYYVVFTLIILAVKVVGYLIIKCEILRAVFIRFGYLIEYMEYY